MRTCAEHWDFSDVVSRLEGAARARQFSSEGDLFTEASLAIKSLMASNKTLHRRAQASESDLASKLAKATAMADFRLSSSVSSFRRMANAFNEIKRINDECRRAVDDGCDGYGYHSVMDWRADGGPLEPGAIYANRFTSSKGGVVTRRPVDVVKSIVDELIRRRAEKD